MEKGRIKMMAIIRAFPPCAGSFCTPRAAAGRRRPRRNRLTDAPTPSILASSQF